MKPLQYPPANLISGNGYMREVVCNHSYPAGGGGAFVLQGHLYRPCCVFGLSQCVQCLAVL